MVPGRKRCASISLALTALVFCTAAQSPPGSDALPQKPAHRVYPAPTNLTALPKEMSGQQVNELMEQWGAELGVRCGACHGEDQDNVIQAGPRPSHFADDSEPMKGIARLMYTMTEQINRDFIAKVEGSGLPVTCGTCHRGRVSPEPTIVAPAAQLVPVQVQRP